MNTLQAIDYVTRNTRHDPGGGSYQAVIGPRLRNADGVHFMEPGFHGPTIVGPYDTSSGHREFHRESASDAGPTGVIAIRGAEGRWRAECHFADEWAIQATDFRDMPA